ncbi:hypothetical protein ES703_95275 [subsurface metagenome]
MAWGVVYVSETAALELLIKPDNFSTYPVWSIFITKKSDSPSP